MECKNNSSKRYTGYENTPLGRGYSASGEEEGKRMKGRDGKMYYVERMSNDVKRWKMVEKNNNPRLFMHSFTASNTDSSFYYRYARYTIYCDVEDDGKLTIVKITKSPFGDVVGLNEIPENVREKIVKNLDERIKNDNPSPKKKKAFRNLKIKVRKSLAG